MSQDVLLSLLARLLVSAKMTRLRFAVTMVTALIAAGKAGFAAVARSIPGPKSMAARLSEVYRACRSLPGGSDLTAPLVHLILSAPDGRVVLATDWSQFGDFKVLMTVLISSSRAVPLMWTVMPVIGDQAAVEIEHFRDLRHALPICQEFIVLADRGFGNSRTIAQLDGLFTFVLRSKAQASFRRGGEGAFTNLRNVGYTRGTIQDFGVVECFASNPVKVRLVRLHDVYRSEPWILLTNSAAPAKTIVRLYKCRFRIEETFRDLKDTRYGFHLRGRFIEQVESVDRLLVVSSCAYLALVLAGLHARRRGWHRDYQTASTKRELADWRLGWVLMQDPRRASLVKLPHLLDQVPNVTLKTGHWDWTPRPSEVLTQWPPLSGQEIDVHRPKAGHTERPCDLALREHLRQVLRARNRSPKQLACYLGRARSCVYDVLNGRQPVPAYWLPKLAAFFDLSEAELTKGTSWTPAPQGRRAKSGSSNPTQPGTCADRP